MESHNSPPTENQPTTTLPNEDYSYLGDVQIASPLSSSQSNSSTKIKRSNSTGEQEDVPSTEVDPSNTPVLNGEVIDLLSFSNDNTPVATNQQPNDVMAEHTRAESPPADSIHSGQLTTLSPPPLSLKSSGSAPASAVRTGMYSSNGSQGMFSKNDTAAAGNNHTTNSLGRKQRPPLPPRGAFPFSNSSAIAAASAVAVDVLPSQPPKQVSHRRVVSTGDVSHISNLTDGDSTGDVDESPENLNPATAALMSTANSEGMFQRQRGVSWDFGSGRNVLGEEPTNSFDIMQPVLSEEDLGKLALEDDALLQPVLDQDDNKTSPTHGGKAASDGINLGKKAWDTLRANRKNLTELAGSKKSAQLSPRAFSKKDGSQFEDEAEAAILAALGMYNISPKEEPSDSPRTPTEVEELSEETVDVGVPSVVSSMQSSYHKKTMSSMSNLEPIEGSPVPPPSIHHLNQKGDLLFEDQGWHDGYDALGRVKGSLREEKDAQIVDEVFGSNQVQEESRLGIGPREEESHPSPPTHKGKSLSKISIPGLMKPLGILRAKTEGSGDSHAASKKKDDDFHENEEEEKRPEPKVEHTRSKTNVSDMAQEFAMYQGGIQNRNKHKVTDSHGVNNLLDGADLLFKAEEKKVDKKPEAEAAQDEDNEEDGEADEEMGRAKSQRGTFKNATRRKKVAEKKQSRCSQMYHWYFDLIKPKVPLFYQSLKHGVLFVYLPLISLAFILYYPCGNPVAGEFDDAGVMVDSAAYSWWILFLVRQFFILGFVKTGEVIIIDIIALRTPIFVKIFGSFCTLMLVQARGWPYIMTLWGIMDFILLFGPHPFAAHWLFWQNYFEIFTSANPAGSFIYSVFYMRILITMIIAGILTALKRLWVATTFGKRSYLHFGPELEIILGKMLLISSVAHLGLQIESNIISDTISDGYVFASITKSARQFPGLATDSEVEDSPARPRVRKRTKSTGGSVTEGESSYGDRFGFGQSLLESGIIKDPGVNPENKNTNKFASSRRLEIMNLLEEWEEPNMHFDSASKTNIKDILQFRQAIALMDDDYCFTHAFGLTTTRAICVDSSEALFNRLVENDPNVNLLPFETIAQIAYGSDGELIRPKVKALIKLFRPDRNGYMSKIDFLNSIDGVYKSIRLFRASLESSSAVDDNLEDIINGVFFVMLVLVSLLIMGFRVWESLLSITTFFFGFSFMFGPASSNYFEGLLLILLRRPYDVGDKIALSSPSSDTDAGGSSTWFVEQVTLFTTTVRFATTNEVATYSNGSLAQLRIINAKRSPKAVLYVYVKFGSDVPFAKLNVYRAAIENFVKARPREWAQLNGIRTTRVEMELNYVEWVIVATHREMWQNIGPILSSKADLASFSLEVSKKLGLRYHQPSKPVHLSFDSIAHEDESDIQNQNVGENDFDDVANLFKKDD